MYKSEVDAEVIAVFVIIVNCNYVCTNLIYVHIKVHRMSRAVSQLLCLASVGEEGTQQTIKQPRMVHFISKAMIRGGCHMYDPFALRELFVLI